MMEFIIEIYDETNFFLEKQIRISADNEDLFLSEIGLFSIEKSKEYEISDQFYGYLSAKFNLNIETGKVLNIRYKMDYDELPYELHNGRELQLMLEGRKPLSVFISCDPTCERVLFPEKVFDQHVMSKRLFKKEIYLEESQRTILYSIPEHQWRMEAYAFLKHATIGERWTESFELLEGLLLGYSKSETDTYIKYLVSRGFFFNS